MNGPDQNPSIAAAEGRGLRILRRAAFGIAAGALTVSIIAFVGERPAVAVLSLVVAVAAGSTALLTGDGYRAKGYRNAVRGTLTSSCQICGVDVPRGHTACSDEHLEELASRTAW